MPWAMGGPFISVFLDLLCYLIRSGPTNDLVCLAQFFPIHVDLAFCVLA